MIHPTRRALLASAGTLALPAIARADATTEISFYFPVAVGGPITKIVDGHAADFMRDNPDIKVAPVYAGSYTDTLTKAQTALRARSGPQMAVLLSTDAFSLIDDELIVPFDTDADAATRAWLDGFFPAFLKNGQIGGHVWGVPFQRSTIVLYYNKAMLKDAGLDPEKPPATWTEHAEAAAKLTRRDGDTVKCWGVQIPATGFSYWLVQALGTQTGGTLARGEGTTTDFASAEAEAALRYWIGLTSQYRAHPPGIVDWATTPRDFLEQKVAMIWHTTGNLSNIRRNASFPFGVAMLPADKRRGSPTGGGNFYVFAAANPDQRRASLQFIRWMSSPERAARWSIDTGYVATSKAAWETPAMRDYVAGFPQAAVARDQLDYAVPELSTHENQRVTQGLNDALQAALTGAKPPVEALEGRAGERRAHPGAVQEVTEAITDRSECHDPPPHAAWRRRHHQDGAALAALASSAASVAQMLVPIAARMAPDARRGLVGGKVMSGLLLCILWPGRSRACWPTRRAGGRHSRSRRWRRWPVAAPAPTSPSARGGAALRRTAAVDAALGGDQPRSATPRRPSCAAVRAADRCRRLPAGAPGRHALGPAAGGGGDRPVVAALPVLPTGPRTYRGS
jgi:sn-glycerol 3-phosphate transport system substrate-binding protein